MTLPISNITSIEKQTQPTYTYRVDFDTKRVAGMVDGHDAIYQAIQKLLLTNRYSTVIYSSNYGVDYPILVGKNQDFVISELERMTREALAVDERVIGVDTFNVTPITSDEVSVSCTIRTIYGLLTMNMEVPI